MMTIRWLRTTMPWSLDARPGVVAGEGEGCVAPLLFARTRVEVSARSKVWRSTFALGDGTSVFDAHHVHVREGPVFERPKKNAESGKFKTEEFSDFGAPKGVTVHVHFGSWRDEVRPKERVRYDLRSERQVQEGKVLPFNASKTSQRHSTSIYNTPSPLRVTTLR